MRTFLWIFIYFGCPWYATAQEPGYSILQTLAHISDYGCDNENEESVADLVTSWNPEIILSTGDDNYALDGSGSCADNIDDNVGKYFADYIYPYTSYLKYNNTNGYTQHAVNPDYRSPDAPHYNRFYSVPGNHDFEAGLNAWLQYFQHGADVQQHPRVSRKTSSGEGNKRYYDFKYDIGGGDSIHFFGLNVWQKDAGSGCIDSAKTPEACNDAYYDSIAAGSEQYNWLKAQLEASDALFKVVFLHKSPYSSLPLGDNTKKLADELKKWDWYKWGADAVIGGDDHYFEVNYRYDIPFIVNGLGGHSKSVVKRQYLTPGNLFHSAEHWGAIKIDVIQWQGGSKDLRFAFYGVEDGGTLYQEYFAHGRPLSIVKQEDEQVKWNNMASTAQHDVVATSDENEVKFNTPDGYVQWDNLSVDELGLDPSGDGYTLSFDVLPGSISESDKVPHYIVWFEDKNSTVLGGLKRVGKNLFIDRYNSLVYPVKSWNMKLWRPNNFVVNQWYSVFMSVKSDMIRIKIYLQDGVDRDDLSSDTNAELTYMAGQSLSDTKVIGLGSIPNKPFKAVEAIKNFKVYDRSFDFRKMDRYYSKQK